MEYSHTSPTRETFVRLFAIVGLFVLAGFLVWLLVQGIRFFPTAFSSLASIAETVEDYGTEQELLLELEKTIVNSGDTVTLNWTDMGSGTYTFAYTCVPGTSLKIKGEGSELRDMSCLESLTLPHDATGLFLSVTGEEQRFSDIPFSLVYTSEQGDTVKKDGRITVVNATVGSHTGSQTSTTTPTTPASPNPVPTLPVPPVVNPKPTTEVATPVAPKPTTPTPPLPRPVTTTHTVSYIPVSNPQGFTDLRTTYLGVGAFVNGSFVPKATFDLDDTAALRFEVKNGGTKTSDTFTYTLTLPGGMTYTSGTQEPLKPNEKATYTVNFEIDDLKAGNTTVKVEVDTPRDTTPTNNDFSWSVKVTS